MKTYMGITFSQLHTATDDQLSALAAAFLVGQIMKVPDLVDFLAHHNNKEKFKSLATEEMAKELAPVFGKGIWDHMKEVYSDERRFTLGAELVEKMGNLSVLSFNAMERVRIRMEEPASA